MNKVKKQTKICQKLSLKTYEQSKRHCYYVFVAEFGNGLVNHEPYIFYIKVCIKDKKTKPKEVFYCIQQFE